MILLVSITENSIRIWLQIFLVKLRLVGSQLSSIPPSNTKLNVPLGIQVLTALRGLSEANLGSSQLRSASGKRTHTELKIRCLKQPYKNGKFQYRLLITLKLVFSLDGKNISLLINCLIFGATSSVSKYVTNTLSLNKLQQYQQNIFGLFEDQSNEAKKVTQQIRETVE